MTRIIRIFCVACFFLCAASLAYSQERIISFDSFIKVEKNGDFTVTEKIKVNAERNRIRRGIFRDLPQYKLFEGQEIPVRYKVLDVTRNGDKEPYEVENVGNARRIKIGNPDRYIDTGTHTYSIRYRIKDEIRRDIDFDEVYWNVTGNYWEFPIESASVQIQMPYGAQFISSDSWGGALGSREKITSFKQDGDFYTFNTTRPLNVREGVTVSLRIEKGIMLPPPGSTEWYIWWLRHGAMILLSLSFMTIGFYYYRAWNRVGRDPAKDPVFPRYEPPQGYSAAAASHIYYRGNRGHKALIAALMGLAIKKWINIETDKKSTTIEVLESPGGEFPSDDEGRFIFQSLFSKKSSRSITLKRKPNTKFNNANVSFRRHLTKKFGKPYYRPNIGYIIFGIFLTITTIFITVSQLSKLTSSWIWGLFAALIITNLIFIKLMPAPTERGQKIRAEIAGLRLYLKTAEKQKFDAVEVGSDAPPPMSIKRYEALLPYAIALGVEEPWSRYFEKVIPTEAKNYSPHWSGSGRFDSFAQMTDHMVSNISSGASAAAPQSSGSSGGGGFSGGGGGGGGGGGW